MPPAKKYSKDSTAKKALPLKKARRPKKAPRPPKKGCRRAQGSRPAAASRQRPPRPDDPWKLQTARRRLGLHHVTVEEAAEPPR